MNRALLPLLLSSFIIHNSAFSAPLPHFTPSPPFHEQTLDQTLPNSVLSRTNAPADYDPAKPTHLIIYLLPNGNTIPQTLGRLLSPGDDWHYDIQHIAAQTRLLRHLDPSRNIILTLLQAPKKSWPAFRADHKDDNPQLIRALVQSAVDQFQGQGARGKGQAEDSSSSSLAPRPLPLAPSSSPPPLSLSLVAHSGGGSFLFGYLNSPDPLPPSLDRIVFLDANYSYSDTPPDHHGSTLLTWLRSSPTKHLVVFCYDDRNVTLNGKKIVSDTGGTYRATHRMLDFLTTSGVVASATTSPTTTPFAGTQRVPGSPHDHKGPFDHYSFLNNQAQFFLHPNPGNKILHTTLIGEMNAYLESLTLDTPQHALYGPLGGPRAYTQYITPSPTTAPSPGTAVPGSPTTQSSVLTTQHLNLPPRPANSPTGSSFLPQIDPLPTPDREHLIADQILSGNVPDSLRTLIPITVAAAGPDGQHTATYYVTPDVLTLGPSTDSFRTPLTPMTAQLIADKLDCSLITRKISNDIYAHATIKLDPRPLTEHRESPATLYQHHQIIESQLQDLMKQQGASPPFSDGAERSGTPRSAAPDSSPLPPLIAGHKKDVVLTPRLQANPHKVAIYGWHKPDGKPIQPLYLGHADTYVDYSHGIRLLSNHLLVDNHPMTVQQVLSSPTLSPLLSDEGPLPTPRYPTTFPSTHPTTTPRTQ